MRKHFGYIVTGLAAVLVALHAAAAAGNEIKAFMSIAVQTAVEDLIPLFEKSSGHKILATWSTGAELGKRLQGGESADILISTRAGIDSLLKEGKIAKGSDVTLANSIIGVAVRRGSPKPDISTADAFKRTLLAAKAISYSNPAAGGASGVHVGRLMERLGIVEEMKAKTKFPPAGGFSGTLLVNGEVDLAIQQIPELAAVNGTELVGPLPGDLQLVTTFAVGVPTAAKQPDAAKAFVRFLQSPQATAVLKAKGLDPQVPATN